MSRGGLVLFGMLRAWRASRNGVPTWPLSTRRRLLIHVGLHKTGTTALQEFLSEASGRLEELGVLYPKSGRQVTPHGHHNIAWQLVRDRKFDPSMGNLADLAEEISAFAGDAIISSEDFESLLRKPDSLLSLIQHSLLKDHDCTILISVRDQASYLESLIFEMLKHGLAEDVDRICEAIIESGQMAYEGWIFHFDYADVLFRLSKIPATVVMRPYSSSSVQDFISFTALDLSDSAGSRRLLNQRQTLTQALSLFCRMRLGEERSAPITTGLRSNTELEDIRVELSLFWRKAFEKRFTTGNRLVARLCGFSPELLPVARPLSPGSLSLDGLFSAREVKSIATALGHLTFNANDNGFLVSSALFNLLTQERMINARLH